MRKDIDLTATVYLNGEEVGRHNNAFYPCGAGRSWTTTCGARPRSGPCGARSSRWPWRWSPSRADSTCTESTKAPIGPARSVTASAGWRGGLPLDKTAEVTLPANRATVIASCDASELTRRGETTHIGFALLTREVREAARATLVQPFFREMKWPKAEVSVRRRKGMAIFESDAFAWRVCLDLDGEQPLQDNFFDVLPGIPTVLDWPAALGRPRVLRVGNGHAGN